MHQVKISLSKLAFLTGLLAGSPVVSALEIEPGIGAGMAYTDNAKLTADNEDNDVIAAGYVGATIKERSAFFHADVAASLAYRNYTSNSFGEQYYPRLEATAGWEMIKHRIDWQAQNFLSQQKDRSLDAETPDNDQNTNVFAFGPNVYFPVSERQRIRVSPSFQDYYYEDSDTDNRQYGVDANWTYKMFPAVEVGLDGAVNSVDYDNENRNPNFTTSKARIVVSGTTSKSEYDLTLGGTYINRDRFENQDGFTGDLAWLYRPTGHSSVRAYLASRLTDTSRELLGSKVTPDNGNFSNVQISGDVLRNKIARLVYRREGPTLAANVWGEYRDQEYKETPNDRDVQEIGAELDYRVTALLTTGIYGTYNRTKEDDTQRRDKRYKIGGNVARNLSRKLRAVLDVRYQNKDSTESNKEYSEFSTFVSLVYGYSDLPGL
jgi:hypothetical protein